MAQIPTSSITMSAIKTEVGVAADGTLDQCRAASNAFTMSSTSVPGHTRDGNEQTNTNASPWNNTMAEWAGYIHTQSFATPTYYVRTGTQESDYCVTNATTHEEYESTAVCNTTFSFKLNTSDTNNYYMEWYMDPDHTVRYIPTSYDFLSRTVSARDTGGSVASFTGNFSSGFTPMKIAQLNVGPQGESLSLEARITSEIIDGVGTYVSAVSGYLITSGWVEVVNSSGNVTTPGGNYNGISPAAWTLPQGDNSTQTYEPYHRLTMQIRATGYTTQTLNKFISHHKAVAISNESL